MTEGNMDIDRRVKYLMPVLLLAAALSFARETLQRAAGIMSQEK